MSMPGSPAVASRPVAAFFADAAIPVAILVAMVAVVMPLPPAVIDLLLAANLTAAVIALLAAIAARTPLEMAVFPTFLLGATLVRLVLNIATTRLILTRAALDGEAAAGQVVEAFGGFVSGNSLAVGAVIFAIIAIVQLVVITAGSSRTSEVAARFTLDAMPGRQMAIDAELKAGSITAAEARRLRTEMQSRSDFFSSMDGASRFVRGEAIAGVVITMINLAGGIAIGTLQHGMPISRAGEVFSRLTIGDGLVTAASSLLVSVAMGLLISRSSHAADLSRELGRQFGGKPRVLGTAAVFLAALSLTGLPFLPLVSVAAVLGVIAWRQRHTTTQPTEAAGPAEEAAPEPLVTQLLGDEAVTVELGRDLLYLVAGPAPVLPARTTALRGSLAADLGIVLPKVVFRDSMESPPRWCRIRVGGEEVYEDTLPAGRVLAVGGDLPAGDDEHAAADPLSHARGRWIAAREVADARQRGSGLHDTADVVMRALEGSVRRRADLLLTRDAVSRLIESVRQSQPAVVDGVVPEILPLKLVHRTLQQLVREGVPIRPLPVVLEIMADHADDADEPETLAEWVRRGLARTICRRARDPSGRLITIRLSDATITRLRDATRAARTDGDDRRLLAELRRAVRPGLQRGTPPVVVVPGDLRRRVRGLFAADLPDVPVLAVEEIANESGVETFATVGAITGPAASAA